LPAPVGQITFSPGVQKCLAVPGLRPRRLQRSGRSW
jgi:hypothetical protein